jgi:hypothetical protein
VHHSRRQEASRGHLRGHHRESALAGAPNPSTPEFEVLRPPLHGVLNEPAGVWTGTPTLVYQPDHGYRGRDDLTYAVRNAAFPGFPSTPATARVAISVG